MKAMVMKSLRFSMPLIILGIGGATAWFIAQGSNKPVDPPPERQIPVVNTMAVEPHRGTLDLEVDGVVAPFREVNVAAEVSGRVVFKSPLCKAGRFVSKGELLIRVDDRDFKLEVDQAEASLAELADETENLEAEVKLAQEDLQLQNDELERSLQLSQEGVVSQSDLDRARQTELMARKTLLTLRNRLRLQGSRKKVLDATLKRAQLALERTEIKAPTDGVIVSDNVEQDAYIQAGTSLFALEDTEAVEVICSLKIEELYWLWLQLPEQDARPTPESVYQLPPTPVTVTFSFNGDDTVKFTWSGVLSRYDGIGVTETTRTVPCRVLVTDPRDVKRVSAMKVEGATRLASPPALVRGMFVTVEFHLEPPTTLLRIPERAVRPGKIVWAARSGKLAKLGPIRLIERVDGTPQIFGGEPFWVVDGARSLLKEGNRLIVSPLVAATEGMAIQEQSSDETGDPLGDS